MLRAWFVCESAWSCSFSERDFACPITPRHFTLPQHSRPSHGRRGHSTERSRQEARTPKTPRGRGGERGREALKKEITQRRSHCISLLTHSPSLLCCMTRASLQNNDICLVRVTVTSPNPATYTLSVAPMEKPRIAVTVVPVGATDETLRTAGIEVPRVGVCGGGGRGRGLQSAKARDVWLGVTALYKLPRARMGMPMHEQRELTSKMRSFFAD